MELGRRPRPGLDAEFGRAALRRTPQRAECRACGRAGARCLRRGPAAAPGRGPAADRGPSGSRGTDPAALLLGAIRIRALRLPLLRRAGPGPPGARAQRRRCRHTRAALRLRQRCPRAARVERGAALAGAERGALRAPDASGGRGADAGDAGAGAGDDRRLDGVGFCGVWAAGTRCGRRCRCCSRSGVGRARSIDLLAETPGEAPLVLDYKTDRLGEGTPWNGRPTTGSSETSTRSPPQRRRGRPSPRRLRLPRGPGEPAITEMGPNDIASARERLEAVVARIGAGEFEVTSTPDWPLCHDCPARRRLCSGPAAAPEEAQPEASPA